MHNLLYVLRLRADESLGLSKTKYEGSRRKKAFGILHKVIMALVAVVLVAAVYASANALADQGYATVLPVLSYLIASVVTFLMTILQFNDNISGDEDSEFLLSMPLGAGTGPLVLFITIYLKSLLYTAFFEIPMIIPYIREMGTTPGFWIHWVIGFLCTCLPISGISSLIGIVIALILSSSSRNNQIQSAIYLVASSGAVALVMNLLKKVGSAFQSGIGQEADETSKLIISEITANYSFARFYQLGIVEANNLYMLLYIVMSAMWYLFFLGLFTISYREFITALRCPVAYDNYELTSLSQKELGKALFGRELRLFLRSKSYLVNSLFGPATAVTIALFFCFVGADDFFAMFGVSEYAEKFSNAVPAVLCFVVALGSTSYCSMSIEGKRHWIVETIPMDEKILVKSKMKISLIITVTTAVILSVLFIIAFRPGILAAVLSLVLPVTYAFLVSWWGIKTDIKHADFSTESERQAMRQSTSFLLAYLPSVLIPLVIAVAVTAL